ncbi:hypothetical protein [Aureimonas mangrovi]|uniref:hypothetical protein n=1 Tax=Aureimonas mangrovi TaxID=2758041 RepID=UPI00163DB7D0|nr:hypothetical protein [Aureimonas mangrovi]
MRILALAAAALLLSACTAEEGPAPMPGADADAHGCRGSAGYSWCPRSNACERPWELAERERIANTPEGFIAFCRG